MRVGLSIVLVVLAGLVVVPVAQANPNMSGDSHCGLHAGKVLRRDSGGTVYRFRIGPRMYHSGGDMACRGHVRKPGKSASTSDGCCSINWQPFYIPDFRDYFNGRTTQADAQAGFTAAGCQAFGEGIVATLVSDGFATPALVVGGGACGYGVYRLGLQLPDFSSLTDMRIVK